MASEKDKLKSFLEADGPAPKCSNDDFATWMSQNRFTTVGKPGSCPSGTKVFNSPSAGSTTESGKLPYIVCRPDNLDMGFSSVYHSFQANYIHCTESATQMALGTILGIVCASLSGFIALVLLVLYVRHRFFMV